MIASVKVTEITFVGPALVRMTEGALAALEVSKNLTPNPSRRGKGDRIRKRAGREIVGGFTSSKRIRLKRKLSLIL